MTFVAVALLSVSLPSIRHEVKLRSNASSTGAVVEAKINGQTVKLLLDTGAPDIVLSAAAASRCRISASEKKTTLSGMNGLPVFAAQASATADFDGLQFENVPVRILDKAPVSQADGLLGTQVFRDYVVEIDAAHRRLRLLTRTEASSAIPFRAVGHMMFVPFEDGYALVDTGSSFSVVDRGRVNASAGHGMPVRTVSGAVTEAQKLSIPARFQLGKGAVLWDRQPVAMDLTALGRKHGLDVRAVIGYPALRGSVIQVDYREQTLRFVD